MSEWWERSKPEQIKPIPWLSPQATAYLEKIIQPDFEVLEHGSGGSTLWMTERCRVVMAVEQDTDWQRAVTKLLDPTKGVIVFSLGAIVPSQKLLTEKFNLLFIDGEPIEDRAKWITAAPDLVKPGGWVVLDNANRPEYEKERAGLRQFAELVKTFNGNGDHHQFLITEFWRMK